MKKLLAIGAAVAVCTTIATFWFNAQSVQVKNIEGFLALTKADPLFYSPFFDAQSFDTAVERLKLSEARLKNTAIENILKHNESFVDTYSSLLREHSLFPITFLASLSTVSAATDAFLTDQSPEHARALIHAYEEAAERYAKEAGDALDAFEKITLYVSGRPVLYSFADAATSLSTVYSDYRLIDRNGAALKKEVERRRACLSGEATCEVTSTGQDITSFFASLDVRWSPSDEASLFVQETLPRAGLERDIRGPYRANSPCFGYANSIDWLYLIYAEHNGARIVTPKLATENYYRLVPASSTNTINQAFIAQGLPFYKQSETTTYECTDLTYYPWIMALDFVQRQIEDGSITWEGALESEKYRQLAQNQFGLLAPALVVLSEYTDLLEASQHTGSNLVLSPQFLFTTRSAYSLTFMPFARSVWRLSEQPRYLLSPNQVMQASSTGYTTYTELRAQGYSAEEIRRTHINQTDIIQTLRKD